MNNLKFQRLMKEMSQAELSKKAGFQKNYLSFAENRNFRPPFGVLVRIADVLEWDGKPEELLDEVEATEVKAVLPNAVKKPFSEAQEKRIREIVAEELSKQDDARTMFNDLVDRLESIDKVAGKGRQ